MAYKIVMPQLGLTTEEGSVTSWLKKPGEWVEKGDALLPSKPTRSKWKSRPWERDTWEQSGLNLELRYLLVLCVQC
jgi:hypothetical protein